MKKKGEILRAIKYTLFAASAGIIQFGLFALLNEVFHWSYWVSYLIALVASVVWNFTFNRRYTFHSANNIPIAMLKVAAYYVVFTPLSTWLESYLTDTLLWNEYLVTIINMLINFITEFIYMRLFVFGKSIDTNDIAKKKDKADEEKDSVVGKVEESKADILESEDKTE